MKSITMVVNKKNIVDDIPDPGRHNEGLLVTIHFPDTAKTMCGVFTTTAGCTSCIFHSYKHCPIVTGKGCIVCAIRGGYGLCSLVNPEELI